MAASGKKSKKNKWKHVSFNELLDTNTPIRKPVVANWADEVEEEDANSFEIKTERVVLPTAPRASRGTAVDENKVPKTGPFQAYLSNIPYDLTEDELVNFFQNLKVKSVTLPRDEKTGNRAKGFGYIEFEDRSSLIQALSLGENTLKGRPIRIELPTSADGNRGGGRGGRGLRDGGRSDMGGGGSDRTAGNWRVGPRAEDVEDRGGGGSGYDRGFSNRRDFGGSGGGGFNKGFDDGRAMDRSMRTVDRDLGFAPVDGKDHYTSNFNPLRERGHFKPAFSRDDQGGFSHFNERSDRGGGFSRRGGDDDRYKDDRSSSGHWRDDMSRREDLNRMDDRKDRDRGGDRFGDRGGDRFGDRGGDRFGDRGGDRFGDRGGDRFGDSGGDRFGGGAGRRGGDDATTVDRGSGSSGSNAAEIKVRQKLQLKPRSVTTTAENEPDAPASSSSIFGGAKPVDTAAREREIEERFRRGDDPSEARSKSGPGSTGSGSQKDVSIVGIVTSEKTTSKAEPPPPPKENVWTSRKTAAAAVVVNNGRTSPEDVRHQSTGAVAGGSTNTGHLSDEEKSTNTAETGRSWSRAAAGGGGDDEKNEANRSWNRGGTAETKRTEPKRIEEPKTRGPQHKGGTLGNSNVEKSRAKEEKSNSKHRDERRKEVDDISRMPKIQENKVPNLTVSNKYSTLLDSDETPLE